MSSLEGAGQTDERRRVLRPNVDRLGQPAQFVLHLGGRLPPGGPQPVPQRLRIDAARDGHQPLPAGDIRSGIRASGVNPVVQCRRQGDGECRAGLEPVNRRLDRQRFDVHPVVAEGPGILPVRSGIVELPFNRRRPLHADLLQPVDELEVLQPLADPLRGRCVGLAAGHGRLGPPGRRQGLGPLLLALQPVHLGQDRLDLPGHLRLPRRPVAHRPADAAAEQHQEEQHQRRHRQAALVPPGELPQPVPRRRRARLHRLVGQVALHVQREAVGRLVAAVAVLLQRLHHDPVQLAADQLRQLRRLRVPLGRDRRQRVLRLRQPGARPGRLLLADDAADLVVGRLLEPLLGERRRAGQQLVQEHAERVDVAAGVDVQVAHAPPAPGDMYSGVPTIWAKPVNSVLSVSSCPSALATPKSITFTTGVVSCTRRPGRWTA